jgi:hypothetical protein
MPRGLASRLAPPENLACARHHPVLNPASRSRLAILPEKHHPAMKFLVLACLVASLVPFALQAQAAPQPASDLAGALTLHASFDTGFNADFSKGDKSCYVRQGANLVPAAATDEVRLVPATGRYGGALKFTKKGPVTPLFKGTDVLNYNDSRWSGAVSVWLRLDPDKDLAPGYCDPVQIVGNDSKKGYIFLEWSKDETPRFFRYAIRPLFPIWNPTNIPWADIPFDKRPMVQVANAAFSHDAWTHVVFTFENINDKARQPVGRLYLNGKGQGSIENWDLTFGWDPAQVQLVLGAAYVGDLDDLAVFNRALTDAEVNQLFTLKNGIRDLTP